jgi:DNA-binding MarR family transcriptional regulator
MAEMLARMERDGVIRREPNPEDKRGSLTSLTSQSRARIAEAKAALLRGEDEATAGFTQQEKALLREFLQRVVRNLEAEG